MSNDNHTTLILGIPEGGAFYVGDTRIVVSKIMSEVEFKVQVEGPITQEFVINDRKKTTVMTNPHVRLASALKGQRNTARVMITALRSVTILREGLYLENHGGNHSKEAARA